MIKSASKGIYYEYKNIMDEIKAQVPWPRFSVYLICSNTDGYKFLNMICLIPHSKHAIERKENSEHYFDSTGLKMHEIFSRYICAVTIYKPYPDNHSNKKHRSCHGIVFIITSSPTVNNITHSQMNKQKYGTTNMAKLRKPDTKLENLDWRQSKTEYILPQTWHKRIILWHI